MSIDADEEILQDFLVEASEIVEQLDKQLVDLEQVPEDADLLNAIFRGFHTVKGGAGFLSIDPLVEVCHRAEDVFNVLRQDQRQLTPELMDPILESLDVVNEMMAALREGEMPSDPDPDLLQRLEMYAVPETGQASGEDPIAETTNVSETGVAAHATQEKAVASGEEITEAEFESLLDELQGADEPSAKGEKDTAASGDDAITDDEFEALLDQIHGAGKHGGAPETTDSKAQAEDPVAAPAEATVTKEQTPASIESGKAASPAAKVSPSSARESDRVASSSVPSRSKEAAKAVTLGSGDTSVRVDTQRLDDIMNMVGELVLVRNRLSMLKATVADEDLADVVGNLDVVTSDLQLAVMKTRMQPVKKVFGRFPRVVRDLARNLDKEVDLEMHGEDTDLDKNLVEALSDPLVHLVRNAVDHGIEHPDEREAKGKSRRGRVVLSAMQEGDHILLCIEDDGKGMDAEVLRRKAVEKGMMDAETAARLDDKECYNLIFHAGFSTREQISDVSGRGVGMDVVKTGIAKINGSVEIDSEPGKGSRITIKLPLTLAILPTLMVVLGNQPFALPLASVVEIFNMDLSRTNTVDGQLTIRVRDRALPLFYLSQWLINDKPESGQALDGHVVVVNVGGVQVGLVVDMLVGQEEVVIKPLGAFLQGQDGMAGATITSDGKIALILDMPGLIRKYAQRY